MAVSAWNHWTEGIAKRLSEAAGTTVQPSEIVVPPDATLGDFAFGCFRLAKERKMNPTQLALEIVEAFDGTGLDLAKATAAGPYINFKLSTGSSVKRVVRDLERAKSKLGATKTGANKQLLFEYAQPNTHKEIHVGHLRNILLGNTLIALLERVGWKVVPVSYHGDVGAHVAKCLWWFVRSRKGSIALDGKEVRTFLSDMPVKKAEYGKYLGGLYAESTRQLEEHPEWKEEISFVQQKLESGDPVWMKLWKGTRQWSLEEMQGIFAELGVRVKRQYLESEVVMRGQEMVDDLLRKKIAKESQGAIVVDLEEKNLGVFLVRKSDGTSLYATKDLALAERKRKEYPKASRNLIMVDNRQSLYFKQLFETLRLLKIEPIPEFIGYDFVTLKSGAMSSRDGNIVTYESFRDSVLAFARQEIASRHADWSEKKIKETAWKLAMGGMKFAFLKQDADKIFTFDLEQALSFDGATGPYCQYAAVRLGSILRKAGAKPTTAKTLTDLFSHDSEKHLALQLAIAPRIIATAATELRPNILAVWCHETAQAINDFYRDVPVLDTEGALREGRLRLAAAAKQALEQGLVLLGIEVPEEM